MTYYRSYSIVITKNLRLKYPDDERIIFKNLNININDKEKVLLLGPSGSGKSTLLNVLSGIIPRSMDIPMKVQSISIHFRVLFSKIQIRNFVCLRLKKN